MPLGVDVSEMQLAGLPWSEWSDRASIAVVRASIGFREDAAYEQFVILAHAAGLTVGAYHALLPGQFYPPARQAADFVSLLMPQIKFLVADVEVPGTSDDDLLGFVDYVDAHSALPFDLYGNQILAAIISRHPELLERHRVWWSEYGPGSPTSVPPYAKPRFAPTGLPLIGWQFAGNNGRLPPYTGQIDLSLWYQSPTEGVTPVPITLTDAQVKQFSAVLDDLTLHLSQIKSQAAAWQTYAQAEADYILTLRPLLVLTPPPTGNWWDSLPAGVFPKPVAYPAQPNPYKIYDQAGAVLATVKPRMNAGQFFERRGDLLRVLDTPISGALWWVRAEELTTTLGPVG